MRGSTVIFGAMLVAMPMLSPAWADDGGWRTEALIRRVLADIAEDGHLSRTGYRCKTVPPDSGAGSLEDCVIPGLDIRSLWIVDERSDNVSISLVGAEGTLASDPPADIVVKDVEALFTLREKIAQMYPDSGRDRCEVKEAQRGDTEAGPLVIGVRNWVTGSRIVLGFGVTKGVVADDRKIWRGEPLDIVGTVLVLNQLDVPCVPVTE